MRQLLFFLGVWCALASCRAEIDKPKLVELPYRVVHDEMLFLRDKDDRRYSVWTDDPAKVPGLLAGFNLAFDDLLLKKGEVLAVFLQDDISQVLTGVVYDKTTRECFADYTTADIMLSTGVTPGDKKRSRLTVVIFTPPTTPNHLGIRSTQHGGLSERVP